jgi:hypothetical protein
VRDRSELFGVPRKQVSMASGVSHGVESVYFGLSGRQFFLPTKLLHGIA